MRGTSGFSCGAGPAQNGRVEKPAFKSGEPSRVDRVALNFGDRFAVVGSTHGDALAHAEMHDRLRADGVRFIFHSGDITGEKIEGSRCVELAFGPDCFAVQGNHDVLAVGREQVHTYDDLVRRTAESTAADLSPHARDLLLNAPVKIDTPFFSIVHESCAPPYYAKRSKRRRKYFGWDQGSSGDENMAAVSFGRIDRPHFIGSDHAAFVIAGAPLVKIRKPRPGEEMILPRRAVVSVPSICFSRDPDYDCGAVVGEVQPDGLLKVRFLSFTPASRTPVYDYVPQ